MILSTSFNAFSLGSSTLCLLQLAVEVSAKPVPVEIHQLDMPSSSENIPIQSPRRYFPSRTVHQSRILSSQLRQQPSPQKKALHPNAEPFVPSSLNINGSPTQRHTQQSEKKSLNPSAKPFVPSKANGKVQQPDVTPHDLAADEETIHDARKFLLTQKADYLHSIGVDPRMAMDQPVYALPEQMYQRQHSSAQPSHSLRPNNDYKGDEGTSTGPTHADKGGATASTSQVRQILVFKKNFCMKLTASVLLDF